MLDLVFEVKPSQVTFEEFSGVSKATGNPFKMRNQFCYAYLGDDYPVKVKLNLEDGQPPYPAGNYKADLASYKVGNYGSLMIDRLKLLPIEKI